MSVTLPVQVHSARPPTGQSHDHGHGSDHRHDYDHNHDDGHDHEHGHDCHHGHDHDYDHAEKPHSALRKRPHGHDHNHGHDHGHGSCGYDHSEDGWRRYLPHSHGLDARLQADVRSLTIALVILSSACALQLVGGIVADADVLFLEAVHSALDGLTVVISLISVTVATRAPTPRYSYGFSRAEVVSALVSVIALALLCVKIFTEALTRLWHVSKGTKALSVDGAVVMKAEAVTLIGNLFTAAVLSRGNPTLNIRALRAHVIADSVENLVVLFAGLIMKLKPTWGIVDPILTLVIVFVIVSLNYGIAREAVTVLLQGAPAWLDVQREVTDCVAAVEGVDGVGAVHVWTLTSGSVIGSAVVFVGDEAEKGGLQRVEVIRKRVEAVFRKVGVAEVTVQVGREESDEGELSAESSDIGDGKRDPITRIVNGKGGYQHIPTEDSEEENLV